MRHLQSSRSRRPLGLFAQTAAARVLGMVAGGVLVVLLARSLDPDQYGVYALFSTTYVFGNLILGLNLSGNLSRQVPGRDEMHASRLLLTFVSSEVALGAAVLFGCLALGLDHRLANALGIRAYASAFRLVLIITWLDLPSGGCLNYLLARKQFGLANALTLLRSSLLGPLLGIAWLLHHQITVTLIAQVWLAGTVVSLAFAVVATGLPRKIQQGFDWTAMKGAVSFGLMLASQSFSFYFLKLADRYVLAHYASLHDIGIYSFSYTLSNIAYSLSALVLVGLFQPHIVEAHNRSDFAQRDALLAQLTRGCITAVVVAALVMALLARRVIFFARPTYLESARVLPWLLLTLVPVVAAYPASILLMLERKLWASVLAGLGAIAVAGLMNLLLVPRFSYYGALAASFVGFSVMACVQHFAARSWRFLAPAHFLQLGHDLVSVLRGSHRSHPSA